MKSKNKTLKKIKRASNEFVKFIQQTIKNYKKMKEKIKAILTTFIIAIIVSSCGSTKVSVSKPAEGTSTTITVTTNNPITTNVTPDVDATFNKKGE